MAAIVEDESSLIENTTLLIRKITQSPLAKLAPHVHRIAQFSRSFEQLSQSLSNWREKQAQFTDSLLDFNKQSCKDCSEHGLCQHSTSTLSGLSGISTERFSNVATPSFLHMREGSTRVHPATPDLEPAPDDRGQEMSYDKDVIEALCSAITNVSLITNVIKQTCMQDDKWLMVTSDLRTAHLQPIFSLQGRKASPALLVHERLLLMCSCQSFASDYRLFETSSGWLSKQDQLVERILTGQDPLAQRFGKHLKCFLATQAFCADKDKLAAGVRFGMKLNVMVVIGESLHLGSGLALLMGYDCQKLSRLNYKAFGTIKHYLEVHDTHSPIIEDFCKVMSLCWSACRKQYHQVHSRISTAHNPMI